MLSASFSRVSSLNPSWLKNAVRSYSNLSRSVLATSRHGVLAQRHLKYVRVTQSVGLYHESEGPLKIQTQPCRACSSNVPQDHKVTALALFTNLKHLKYTPPPALILGVAGLIPFVAAPTYMILTGVFYPSIAFSQVAYGACILSFLGGIRWGMTMPEETLIQPNWFNIGYSIVPPTIAWLGLLFPTPLALLTLISGIAGSAYMDTILWGVPVWFKALRFVLSLGAILALWTTLMCRLTLSEEKQAKVSKVKVTETPALKPALEASVKQAVVEPVMVKPKAADEESSKDKPSTVNHVTSGTQSKTDTEPEEKEYTEKD